MAKNQQPQSTSNPVLATVSAIWSYYYVEILFRDFVAGGVPATTLDPSSRGIVDYWIKDRLNDAKDQQEVIDAMGGDLPAEIKERSLNTFMRRRETPNSEPVLCLRDYQIKALLAESANLLGYTKAVRGLKNAITNGVYVRPAWIPLGVTKASCKIEVAGHVIGPQGPRSILSCYDLVEKPRIHFYLKINNRVMEAQNKMIIDENHLRDIFEHAQESGLGSARKRGFGTFDVTEFRVVDAAEAIKAAGEWSKMYEGSQIDKTAVSLKDEVMGQYAENPNSKTPAAVGAK